MLKNPYAISTFGRAYTQYQAMQTLISSAATAEELTRQWEKLNPLLSKIFCESLDENAHAFTSEYYTGIQAAKAQGLPDYMHEAWDRMRLLQGLAMNLQMWIFVGCAYLENNDNDITADQYSYYARELINAISDVMEECDAIPDGIEDWAVDIINACQLEAQADDTTALNAARYIYLRERDLETISKGGVFVGMTPDYVVLNGEDLDKAVDAGRAGRQREHAAAPVESVLINGAAYEVHADVAAELLGLHIELQQSTAPQATLAAAHPAKGIPARKFFSFNTSDDLEIHDTADAARAKAQEAIDLYREDAAEGWDEDVSRVCWGEVLEEAVEIPPKNTRSFEGVDYVLQPISPPAQGMKGGAA